MPVIFLQPDIHRVIFDPGGTETYYVVSHVDIYNNFGLHIVQYKYSDNKV